MTLYALDCCGRSSVILQAGPRVEGGIAVAPRTFGRFACQLIAPDEHSGRIFAFDRRGRTRVVSQYRFPAGGDIGVESVGFVPPGSDRRGAAYLADLGAPGAPTPGTSPADAPWAGARARGRAARAPPRSPARSFIDSKWPDPSAPPLPPGSTPRADSLLWPALAREAKTPPEPGASDG